MLLQKQTYCYAICIYWPQRQTHLQYHAFWLVVTESETDYLIGVQCVTNNKFLTCAPSEDLDPPSQIRVFAVRLWVAKDTMFLHAGSEGSDQTGRMPRLIWIFSGRTGHFVVLVVLWLKWHQQTVERRIPAYALSSLNANEPPHYKTNKMACAPIENSDQPGHPHSLHRVFAVGMKKAWVLSYPLSAQRRLNRLGGCLGWSKSSLGAHATLLVLSRGGSNHRRSRSIKHVLQMCCF